VAESVKKAVIMPTLERGVSSRLRFHIGVRVGNVGEKAWQ
jgi:hypothetical protein